MKELLAAGPVAGSLSSTMGLVLTLDQRKVAVHEMRSKPCTATMLVKKVGLSETNPFSGEAVRRLLAELETARAVKQVKKDGKLIGYQLDIEDE